MSSNFVTILTNEAGQALGVMPKGGIITDLAALHIGLNENQSRVTISFVLAGFETAVVTAEQVSAINEGRTQPAN